MTPKEIKELFKLEKYEFTKMDQFSKFKDVIIVRKLTRSSFPNIIGLCCKKYHARQCTSCSRGPAKE